MATEHLGSEGGGAARGTSPVLLPDLLDPPCHLLRSRRRLKLALSSLKLIVLDLQRVGGKPEAFVRMFKGLAANPASLLSVINLNGNHVGNEGAKA